MKLFSQYFEVANIKISTNKSYYSVIASIAQTLSNAPADAFIQWKFSCAICNLNKNSV